MNDMLTDKEACRELVQRTAALLDAEQFDTWIALFDPEGVYELASYSTEIRSWMTWWRSDRPTLAKLLGELAQHVRDPAKRRHIVSSSIVTLEGDAASVHSDFSIYRTTPDGQTSLYMVGCYEDRLVRRDGKWLYTHHKAISDTRVLETFTHVPV